MTMPKLRWPLLLLMFLLFTQASPVSHACGFVPQNLQVLTRQSAQRFGLESELLMALVWTESRYCVDAISRVGAIGLGQLMPATARMLGVDPRDPAQNLHGAALYLRMQWDTFRNWEWAIAAYNAGPGAVKKYGGIPPYLETQRYVRSVLSTYFWLKRR